jgi:hypothetical protein
MSSEKGDLYTVIRTTAQAFVDSYKQDNCGKDITALSSTRTPDCRHFFLPSTLLATAPVLASGRTNAEYEAQILHEITHVFKTWDVITNGIVVDERQMTAVVSSSHRMVTGERKEYVFDFLFTLTMTDDGKRVRRIEQFVDTALAGQLMQEHKSIAEAHQKG